MNGRRVLLISENLSPPFDEGIKKSVYHLYLNLKQRYQVRVLCREGIPGDGMVVAVKTNKLFLGGNIRRQIKSFMPETIIYFPFASATFASYLREAFLKFQARDARHLMIALQPKPINSWQNSVIRMIKPDQVLTPSPELKKELDTLNIPNTLIPLWTDLQKFSPLTDPGHKTALREKYNIPADKFVISHMGHLNEGRNLESLIALQDNGVQVVIVESTSTPKDASGPANLKKKLLEAGILVINQFIPEIEDIYHLSDLYIFPVVNKTGSIGLPLSILEARACGIPVLTTNFGSVKQMLGDDSGNIFYSEPENFKEALVHLRKSVKKDQKSNAIHTLNEEFLNGIINKIEYPN